MPYSQRLTSGLGRTPRRVEGGGGRPPKNDKRGNVAVAEEEAVGGGDISTDELSNESHLRPHLHHLRTQSLFLFRRWKNVWGTFCFKPRKKDKKTFFV